MLHNELSHEERVNFIESLELCETPEALRSICEGAGDSSASVDAGTVASFVNNVSGQSKSDVLNSMLLAQLAATKQYDPENDPVNWYAFYKTVLGNIGWVIESFGFNKFEASSATIDLGDVIINLVAAIATDNELKAIMAAIKALRALSRSSSPGRIFDTSSHSSSAGNFRIAACAEHAGGVSTTISSSYFSSTETVTSIFWSKFSSSDMQLYYSTQSIHLNQDIYKTVRQQVINKLGNRASQYIAELEI